MLRMSAKAQVTAEFLLLISFLFVLSVGFFVIAADQLGGFRTVRVQVILDDFSDSVHRELVLASSVQDGYSRTIELPEKVDGKYNYTITLGNSTLTVEMENEVHTSSIPLIMGTLEKGSNTLKKINGTVVIEHG